MKKDLQQGNYRKITYMKKHMSKEINDGPKNNQINKMKVKESYMLMKYIHMYKRVKTNKQKI